MNPNILSVIVIFVLFIPVSFANGVDDSLSDDSLSDDLLFDDSVYDNAAKAAIEKSLVGTGQVLNSDSILINYDERLYVFSQTIQRDSNGMLVAFLQSDKMTQISPSTIHYWLDARAMHTDIPVYDFEGIYVQAYGEKFTNIIPLKDITASTMLVVEVVDTGNLDVVPPSLGARYAHDGIVLEPGDEVTTTWWVARVLN